MEKSVSVRSSLAFCLCRGTWKRKKGGDATAVQSRAMSVSARARGQLEHAHYAYWRLNGEHCNAHTVDLDHAWWWSNFCGANEETRTCTCRSCRNVLSEQQVYNIACWLPFCLLGPVPGSRWESPMANGWRRLGTGKGWWRRNEHKAYGRWLPTMILPYKL